MHLMHYKYLIWNSGHISYLINLLFPPNLYFDHSPSAPTNEVQCQMLGTERSMTAQESESIWFHFNTSSIPFIIKMKSFQVNIGMKWTNLKMIDNFTTGFHAFKFTCIEETQSSIWKKIMFENNVFLRLLIQQENMYITFILLTTRERLFLTIIEDLLNILVSTIYWIKSLLNALCQPQDKN